MTTYRGIDYSLGKANVDKKGIHYGVISCNEILQTWSDESESYYGSPCCPKCGYEFTTKEPKRCPKCRFIDFDDFYFADPISYFYKKDGYICEQDVDGQDIFVCKSPYYTYAQYCSPCAPGACYLLSPISDPDPEKDVKCYCFGHDWFETGKAPYPVYSIKTGKLLIHDAI